MAQKEHKILTHTTHTSTHAQFFLETSHRLAPFNVLRPISLAPLVWPRNTTPEAHTSAHCSTGVCANRDQERQGRWKHSHLPHSINGIPGSQLCSSNHGYHTVYEVCISLPLVMCIASIFTMYVSRWKVNYPYTMYSSMNLYNCYVE